MSYTIAEGTRFFFAALSTFGAAKTVSAITNQNPAVASAAAHGFSTNDELLFTSGWEDASNTIWRGTTIDAGSLSLQGLDATGTNQFPAGSGAGTLQKVGTWIEIPQVLNVQGSGGNIKTINVEPLNKRNAIVIPTGFDAMKLDLTLGHDPNLAAYQQMIAIGRSGMNSQVGFKLILGGGGVGYGFGYLSASEMPNITKGQVNQVTASISLLGRFITYAS